jgi:hypothetical protein
MGAVYQRDAAKRLPAGAKSVVRKGQRLAEWKDAKGKTRTAGHGAVALPRPNREGIPPYFASQGASTCLARVNAPAGGADSSSEAIR